MKKILVILLFISLICLVSAELKEVTLLPTDYEVLSKTEYSDKGFNIKAYEGDKLLGDSSIDWIKPVNTTKFYTRFRKENKCIPEYKLFTNQLESKPILVKRNQFWSLRSKNTLNYQDLINSKENKITNITIEPLILLEETIGYYIKFEGEICNTDPSLDFTYDSSDDLVFSNQTEGTSLGARLDAPVLFMDFNSAPEGTYVQDNSLYNNYGTTSGSPTYNSSCDSPAGGSCYSFDGVDDYIDMGSDSSLDDLTPISVSGWIYLNGWGESDLGRVLSKYSATEGWEIFVVKDTANYNPESLALYKRFDGDDGRWSTSANSITTGGWIHFAMVYDDSSASNDPVFYLNGEQETLLEGTTPTGSSDGDSAGTMKLATRSGGDYTFDGSIDQVQIWDRALTADEISNLYNGTKNNSDYIGKYSSQGDFKSLVFYNSTSSYWNTTFNLADSNGSYKTYDLCQDENSCLGYWDFDSVIKDDVGGVSGLPRYKANVNKTGGALNGAGVFDRTAYFRLDDLDFTTDLSMSMWVNLETTSDYQIMGKRNSYYFGYLNNPKVFYAKIFNDSTQYGPLGTSTPVVGEWYHVVMTYNGTDINLYVNGSLENTTHFVGGIDQNDYNTLIGNYKEYLPSGVGIDGKVDEFGIWNKALNSTEVSQLWNSGNAVKPTTVSDGLVGSWSMDDSGFNDNKRDNHLGATDVSSATGVSSGAFNLDGSSDYLVIGYEPIYNLVDTPLAFSGWIKTSTSGNQGLVSKYPNNPSNPNPGFGIGLSLGTGTENSLAFWSGAEGSWKDGGTGQNLADGKWHHVVVSLNSSEDVEFYVDGKLDATDSTSFANEYNSNIYFGRLNSPGYNFEGELDEFLLYNNSLTASEIQELYKAGLSQHANTNITLQTRTATSYNLSDENLYAFWPFNDSLGSETTNEVISGTLGWVGSGGEIAIWGEENGIVGGAYNFDGGNDYISTGVGISGLSSLTISLWVYPTTSGNQKTFISNDLRGWDNSIQFGIDPENLATDNRVLLVHQHTATSTRYTVADTTDIELDKWTHYLYTYNGSQQRLYRNGVLVDTNNAVTFSYTGTFLRIAGNPQGFRYFNGSIDEVRIYNRSLSADEVQNLYELGSYHIEWNSWNDEGKIEDGIADTSTSQGNFFQFKPIFNTNDTDVSSYLLNYSIGPGIVTPPSDTCTYTSGNWFIECSDYCNITSNVAVDNNANITFNGTGIVRITANITNWLKSTIIGQDSSNKCTVRCSQGGCLK